MKHDQKFLLRSLFLAILLGIGVVSSSYASKAIKNQQLQFVEISNISTGGDTFEVKVVEDLAYVIDMNAGFKILNVSDPFNPTLLGAFYDGGIPHEMFLDGDLAYIADHTNGLEILNISNPSNPTKIGQIRDTGDGEADGIFVANNRAYVAEWHDSTWSWKMLIIDVSDPSSPIKLAEYVDTDGEFLRFFTVGEVCYAACLNAGFKILNVSSPTNITEIGHYSDGGRAGNFQIIENTAYVADGGDGLEILDVSDKKNPVELGQYDTDYPVFDVQIIDDLAYIVEDVTGLKVLNISNPTSITLLGSYTRTNVVGVYVQDNYVYLAQHGYGLQIVKMEGITSISSSTALSTSGWTLGMLISALTVSILLWRLRRSKHH
ncbi:MAG: LVIVD repeat-containing protein [Candidatus Hodarchaeota archaeon]